MLNEDITAITEGQELTCFVRHADAGGQCLEPGTREVHGLNFCERHGLEAEIAAGLEARDDATYFFERFRNPHVPVQGDAIERTLEFALDRLREEAPADLGHQQALMDAYPAISDAARKKVVRWIFDQDPDEVPVLDILLSELHTMHKVTSHRLRGRDVVVSRGFRGRAPGPRRASCLCAAEPEPVGPRRRGLTLKTPGRDYPYGAAPAPYFEEDGNG